MKRYIAIAVISIAALLGSCLPSYAKNNLGVIGGATFNTNKFSEFNPATLTQYHAGLAFKFRMPLGFALQPSLLYQVKGARFSSVADVANYDFTMGFVEVPVSLQWGPDLIICRPFVDVTPFFGYALNNARTGENAVKNDWTNIDRWEYGIGLGGGIDIWKFQISCRYNWNFGSLSKFNGDDVVEAAGNKDLRGKKFSGVTLSLAFFF